MISIVFLGIAGLLIALAIIFAAGKGAWLIAGYNTASAREQAKTDEKKLCKAMSRLMLALAACCLVSASSAVFNTKALIWIGQGLFFVSIITGVVFLNTGNRFRK